MTSTRDAMEQLARARPPVVRQPVEDDGLLAGIVGTDAGRFRGIVDDEVVAVGRRWPALAAAGLLVVALAGLALVAAGEDGDPPVRPAAAPPESPRRSGHFVDTALPGEFELETISRFEDETPDPGVRLRLYGERLPDGSVGEAIGLATADDPSFLADQLTSGQPSDVRVDGAVVELGNDGPDSAIAKWTLQGRGYAVIAYGLAGASERVLAIARAQDTPTSRIATDFVLTDPDPEWTLLYDGPQLLGPPPGVSGASLRYQAGDEYVLVTDIAGWNVALDGLGWLGEDARRTVVRGHDALLTWTRPGGGNAEYHVLWQERPGLTLAVDGSDDELVLAVAEGLAEVDEVRWRELVARAGEEQG